MHVLSTAKPTMAKAIIEAADKDIIKCLCECAHNIIKGTVPLKENHLKHLQRYKADIRTLAKSRTPQKKKKKILQRGGFLPALLAPIAASVLADLL